MEAFRKEEIGKSGEIHGKQITQMFKSPQEQLEAIFNHNFRRDQSFI